VKQRRPSRPSATKKPSKARRTADPMDTPMERSYAQKQRTDRAALSFGSKVNRASFWAQQAKQLADQNEQQLEDDTAAISQGTLQSETQFASANIEEATLQSAPPPNQPSIDSTASIAGIDSGTGVAPPPPPR
jgi:hypothetical protein